MVPSTIPVVEDKSLKTQYQVMEVDPAADKGNPTTSSANYESSPGQILSSLRTIRQSAGEQGWCTRQRWQLAHLWLPLPGAPSWSPP